MPSLAEREQVASGSTAQVEDPERALPWNGFEQRIDVLGDVVMPRAPPELAGALLVVLDGNPRSLGEL
jgi:hypothetical protein